jgi:hypothetical protein
MKRYVGIVITAVLFLAIMGTYSLFIGPNQVMACGCSGSGSPGGGDYVPQRRGSSGSLAPSPSLTKEQAYDIVANHVSKLNPNLKVGKVNDAGGFYEVEIVSDANEVIQRLGVDKESGRLMLIN